MECIDISENCRACQNKTPAETQIFMFTSVKIPDIFKETTSLDIQENDALPKILCCTCYDRLLEAYNFRKMCSAAVVHFQKILSMDVPEKKYIPPENIRSIPTIDTTLMDLKPDPYVVDEPSSPLRDISSPLNIEDTSSDISIISIYDNLPEILKSNPVDDASLTHKNREDSPVSQKKIPMLLKEHNNLVWCGPCNLQFRRKWRLEMHMREKHMGLKAFQCQICGKEYGLCGYKFHMERKHGKLKKYPCPESKCKRRFDAEWRLYYHMKRVHNKKNPVLPKRNVKECEVPEKEIETLAPPKIHEVPTSISGTQRPMRSCKLDNLSQHIIRQKAITQLKTLIQTVCPLCGVEKDTPGELNSHMSIHKKGDKWSCEYCPYKSPFRKNMKRHVKVVHQGIKDFHCPHCEKSFGTAMNLKRHAVIHTGQTKSRSKSGKA